jgi:hypothetical protein
MYNHNQPLGNIPEFNAKNQMEFAGLVAAVLNSAALNDNTAAQDIIAKYRNNKARADKHEYFRYFRMNKATIKLHEDINKAEKFVHNLTDFVITDNEIAIVYGYQFETGIYGGALPITNNTENVFADVAYNPYDETLAHRSVGAGYLQIDTDSNNRFKSTSLSMFKRGDRTDMIPGFVPVPFIVLAPKQKIEVVLEFPQIAVTNFGDNSCGRFGIHVVRIHS